MKNTAIRLLNVEECYMLNRRLIDVFEVDLQKDASVAAVLPHLNELTADLFAILAKNKSRSLTKKLAEKDEARDAAFISFRDYCNSFVREPDPVQSSAADELTALIREVGWTLYSHGYTEQTAAEENLIKKLAEPIYAAAIKAIKAESRAGNLQATNVAFEDVLKLKTEAEAQDNIPPVRDCKGRMIRYLKPLLSHLELMADVRPDTYAVTVTRMRESVEYVLTVAKARRTRKGNLQNEQEATDGPGVSADPEPPDNPAD